MSFKEVTTLRKSGKLKEALKMAEKDLKNEPDNDWNKRAIVWVYYSYMKNASEKNDLKEIIKQIENVKKLNLPDSDKMAFDSIAWIIGKYLFNNKVDSEILNRFYELIKDFSFSKPNNAYSYLLKAFNRQSAQWDRYIEFTQWWGSNNFMPEDYKNFVTDSGRKLPAMVESIYISISKRLLTPPLNRDAIEQFIPQIAKITHENRSMQYPPYYYAKMLLALGDRENFIKAFLPFARKKKNDFWVWDLMSEVYEKDSSEYFSCLCKSLSCGAPGKFTINVKEKLANLFVSKGMFREAKNEYQDIIKIRSSEGWTLRDKHLAWQKLPWWNNTVAEKNNFRVYEENKSIAEKLLYADKPETIIVVDTVNKEKTVFSFIASKELNGFIHYGRLGIAPQPGDVYAVRFSISKKENKSNFRQVYSIHKTEKSPPPEIYKIVSDKITIRPGNSFGFVDNAYVPVNIISSLNIKSEDEINAVTLLSYNRKKRVWNWKVVKVL